MTPAQMAALHAAAMALRAWSAEEFAGLIETGAFATGDTRAFALARVIVDEAELLTIATHPEHRRQGCARAALDAFHDEAARRGADRAFLEVGEWNRAAMSLYASAGYTEIGRRRGYYPTTSGGVEDAIVMARDLSSN